VILAIIAKSETVVNAAEWDLEDLEIVFGYRELRLCWKLTEVVVGHKVAFAVWPNSDGSGRQRFGQAGTDDQGAPRLDLFDRVDSARGVGRI